MQFKPNIELKLQIQTKLQLFLAMDISLLLTHNIPQISTDEKLHMMTKSMMKIKYFLFRSQTNGIYDLQYILRYNASQTSNSNSKQKRNYSFCSYGYPCPSHTHYPIHISIDEKSCMQTKSMLKIKNFSFRSQTNDRNDL